jgi:hypothetical protein
MSAPSGLAAEDHSALPNLAGLAEPFACRVRLRRSEGRCPGSRRPRRRQGAGFRAPTVLTASGRGCLAVVIVCINSWTGACRILKLDVAGSNPVARSFSTALTRSQLASISLPARSCDCGTGIGQPVITPAVRIVILHHASRPAARSARPH